MLPKIAQTAGSFNVTELVLQPAVVPRYCSVDLEFDDDSVTDELFDRFVRRGTVLTEVSGIQRGREFAKRALLFRQDGPTDELHAAEFPVYSSIIQQARYTRIPTEVDDFLALRLGFKRQGHVRRWGRDTLLIHIG